MDNIAFVADNTLIEVGDEGNHIQTLAEHQAECFLMDAEEYRSINHKIDLGSLEVYRFLYSKPWQIIVIICIVLLHCLAFLEYPSSLSYSSVVTKTNKTIHRVQVPQTTLFCLEASFLNIIFADVILQTYVLGFRRSFHSFWIVAFFGVMVISWIDFFVNIGIGITYVFRVRRFFRPIFAIQKSHLMKTIIKSLSKSLGDIMSACVLLLLWVFGFSLLAVSIFSGPGQSHSIDKQYISVYGAFFNLLVLLTTANNPDAMIKEYNRNRLTFLFFLIYMVVGIFVFMNALFAIVFNEFRGHVRDSMQTCLLRRRIAFRAIFEVLRQNVNRPDLGYDSEEIGANILRRVIKNSPIPEWRRMQIVQILDSLNTDVIDWYNMKHIMSPMDDLKESKKVFNIPKFDNKILTACQKFFISTSFEIIGLLVCFANVLTIAVDISTRSNDVTSSSIILDGMNWAFISIYIIEQIVKCIAMGYKVYFTRKTCVFDLSITIIILVLKSLETAMFNSYINRFQYLFGDTTVWDVPRITNLFVMLRAVRIVLILPSLTPIIDTLCDIPWRLRSIIGFLAMLFYMYALLGMLLFRGSITPQFMAQNETDCGTYQQLDYGGINFDDFYSSIVLLWCLLIVNNWQVFMIAFAQAANSTWVHVYMISWWILAVITVLNCVTAFVIEGYSQRKAYFEEERAKRLSPKTANDVIRKSIEYLRRSVVVNNTFTFQMLFRNEFIEPSEEELISELKKYNFLCEMYPHIDAHSNMDD